MTRAGILLITLLVLDACAPLVGTECTSGVYRACTLSDGRSGTQACLSGLWRDCTTSLPAGDGGTTIVDSGTSTGTDGSLSGNDSGIYIWPDAGMSVMTDAGTGIDAGWTCDPRVCDPTPESLQRQYCEDRRPLSDTSVLTVRYDNTCLDRLFGACVGGWSLVGWDDSVPSCPSPSDHGSGILVMNSVHRRGGYYQLSLDCNDGRTPGWPDTLRNVSVNAACITSVYFEDGVELADNEARYCPSIVTGVGIMFATVPTQIGAVANCP